MIEGCQEGLSKATSLVRKPGANEGGGWSCYLVTLPCSCFTHVALLFGGASETGDIRNLSQ